jgi:hypothetical protein
MKTNGLCKAAIAIGLSNYALCVLTFYLMGGDALHGHVAQNHAYVVVNGGFIEVSHAMFMFCKWQAYSLVLTFPLGLLGACFLTPAACDANELEFTGGDENASLSPHTS